MNAGLVHGEPIHKAIYRALPPEVKLVWLANQKIVIDDAGRPCVADDVLAVALRDVEEALGLRPASELSPCL